MEHWGSGRRASGKQEASGGARFLGSMRMQGLQEVLAGDPYGGGREAAREVEEVAGTGDEWIEGKVVAGWLLSAVIWAQRKSRRVMGSTGWWMDATGGSQGGRGVAAGRRIGWDSPPRI